jgi:GNAT superfamily N-acetyltransferase
MELRQQPGTDMPSIPVIRLANEDDLPAVLALYAQPGFDDGRVLSIEEARKLFSHFAAYPDYTLYVAEMAGLVVGTFALLIMDNLAHRGSPSGVVEDVAVASAFQSRGIGRAMMAFAMARCRERGCYKLALSSNLKREGAHRFYESLGFQQHGVSFVVDLD